ncbi:MAG: DUF6327 family protein [Aequorivita sp.]
MKRYNSFEEIDTDLKYLRLKSKIDWEEIKIGVANTKETFGETFSPINLVVNVVGSVVRKVFVFKMIDKLIGIKPVKRKGSRSK